MVRTLGPSQLNPAMGGLDLNDLLAALQAMRMGDFTTRLAGNQIGLAGKIADTFNEIVTANERMAQQLENVGQVVGREGKTAPACALVCPTVLGETWNHCRSIP